MGCTWEEESSVGNLPVTSTEASGQDDNHSARDIQALLHKNGSLEPPACKRERVKWPASTDAQWNVFDESVMKRLLVEQKGKRFQEKMTLHCDAVYEEGTRLFGLRESDCTQVKAQCFNNRRKEVINGLVVERKSLRRKARKARSLIEKEGYGALLRVLAEKLMKLRRAESRRLKQREVRKVKGGFGRDPFGTIKGILDPSPVGELRCSKEELDEHLGNTYGDIHRDKLLGVLQGLPEHAAEPSIEFDLRNISLKENWRMFPCRVYLDECTWIQLYNSL